MRVTSTACWLAKNQNQSDLIGGVNIASVDRQFASVLVDMTSSWTINYSLGLGASVLNEMKSVEPFTQDRRTGWLPGSKGQGILFILVETAFISNPNTRMLID